MLKNEYLKQWTRIVSEKMPHLSIPQVVGLATWSFGMVMTKSSSLTKVSQFIAVVNGEKVTAVRQRLREWYEEAEAKKGLHRRSLDVSSCFAPLLMWVLSLLPANIKQIALALDATTIGDKFVVLSLNILLAGCGIPIAWCVVLANKPESWKGHWHNTRLLHPQRAERLWLAIAVSTLGMVMLGGEVVRSCRLASESNYRTRKGEAENQSSPPNLETLPSRHIVFSQPLNLHPQRHISCFLQGLLTLIANLLNHLPIQLHRWSSFPSTPVDDFYCFNSS